jgi:hypothetical protein
VNPCVRYPPMAVAFGFPHYSWAWGCIHLLHDRACRRVSPGRTKHFGLSYCPRLLFGLCESAVLMRKTAFGTLLSATQRWWRWRW